MMAADAGRREATQKRTGCFALALLTVPLPPSRRRRRRRSRRRHSCPRRKGSKEVRLETSRYPLSLSLARDQERVLPRSVGDCGDRKPKATTGGHFGGSSSPSLSSKCSLSLLLVALATRSEEEGHQSQGKRWRWSRACTSEKRPRHAHTHAQAAESRGKLPLLPLLLQPARRVRLARFDAARQWSPGPKLLPRARPAPTTRTFLLGRCSCYPPRHVFFLFRSRAPGNRGDRRGRGPTKEPERGFKGGAGVAKGTVAFLRLVLMKHFASMPFLSLSPSLFL